MILFSMRSIVAAGVFYGAAGAFGLPALAATSGLAGAARPTFTELTGSVQPTTDVMTGALNNPKFAVSVVLAPRNEAQLTSLLSTVANPKSPSYGHWLQRGQFNALFAPSSAQAAAVEAYLRTSGLVVEKSSSPFYVRASGTSRAIAAAFRTSLRTYRNPRGIGYFANASAVQLPANLASSVLGVVGLSSSGHTHPQFRRALGRHVSAAASSCEAPYPTATQLFDAVNLGVGFPFGYGGSPGCNGLTPSQINSIYGAPNVGPRAKGAGVNLALFELSAYQHSDILEWARHYYGPNYNPPLVDIVVDGGPLKPACPALDLCPPQLNGYYGDVEVALDIEMSLAVAPNVSHVVVYNAPNDVTNQTSLDEYARMANDDIADTISSSWGNCENDVTPAFVQAEDLIFKQMALQGQSIFNSSGDTGAFGCIRGDGSTLANSGDPASQPWVTSVGGTSLESFNPGTQPNPKIPPGVETVWNVANLCNASADEGGHTGFFWCAVTGAGGGGNSEYWGRPFFQFGPGISNRFTRQCALASNATPCRESPDISANADEYTPFGVFCTGTSALPFSACATYGSNVPGWVGIGGTSESSPFVAAVVADRDSFQGTRTGNAAALLYLANEADPSGYFNDITGIHQATSNNGLFPTVPGYDLATGVGTPKMSAVITGVPQE